MHWHVMLLRRILFFSSRIRHMSWPRDWSSDVCSSDLSKGLIDHFGDSAGCPHVATKAIRLRSFGEQVGDLRLLFPGQASRNPFRWMGFQCLFSPLFGFFDPLAHCPFTHA